MVGGFNTLFWSLYSKIEYGGRCSNVELEVEMWDENLTHNKEDDETLLYEGFAKNIKWLATIVLYKH